MLIKLKLPLVFEFSSVAASEVFSAVVAIDCDEGTNARVHYSIVDVTGMHCLLLLQIL